MCVGVTPGAENKMEEEMEELASESDPEFLRGGEQEEEYELDPVFQSSEEETREPSSSPEREVTLTPAKSTSRNARKNAR